MFQENRNVLGSFPPPSQPLFIISDMFRNWYWGDLPYTALVCLSLVLEDGAVFVCHVPLVLLLSKPQDRLDSFGVSLVRSFFFKFSSLIPLCLSHLWFKRHSKVSRHQMFRPSDIVCNPLPLNIIIYLKNKFWSSWLWTKFSLHKASEIKRGVICCNLQQQWRGEKYSA